MAPPLRYRGLGVAATIAVAVGFTAYYSIKLAWEDIRPWKHFKVSFTKTAGLKEKDDVLVHGLLVGRVHKLKLEEDHQLADVEVEPYVHLYHQKGRVLIESVNAFGDVAIFIEPGEADSTEWTSDDIIPGELQEGFVQAPDSGDGTHQLSDTIKDVEAGVDSLLSPDSGMLGRLLNDADLANSFKESFATLDETFTSMNEAAAAIEDGEGMLGALTSNAVRVQVDDTSLRIRNGFESVRDSVVTARQGEGFTATLVGDSSPGDAVREAVHDLSVLLEDYRSSSEDQKAGLLSRSPAAADKLSAMFQAFAEDTSAAERGEGSLGGFVGPDSGQSVRDVFAGLDRSLEGARSADPGAGTILSPAVSGRREVQDALSKLDEVLRDLRGALMRIRASQAPNTFPGALFSVF